MAKKKPNPRRPVSPATLHRYIVWYCDTNDLFTGSDKFTVRALLKRLESDTVAEANRR